MLFYASYKIAREAISKLLGERPEPDLIDKIRKIAADISDTQMYLHNFRYHDYITCQEMTFHIMLKKDLSIETGHEIATNLEKKIFQELGIEATIHVEPLN
jgi:divalent metal cation (Fe/Co/Zn/Cd) transporter